MDRWNGKVAVVTGASSGIGEAIIKDLLKNGLIVVGLARRYERLLQNKSELPANLQKNYHPIQCDISNEESVKSTFDSIEKKFGGVHVLVNNAGVYKKGLLSGSGPEDSDAIKQTLNTNVMGVVHCTREAFKSMKKNDVAGHVVLINSVAGHKVIRFGGGPSNSNMYFPSKFAVTAMTEVYRMEFIDQKTKVKITSVFPGLVDTEIVPEEVKLSGLPMLKSEDISSAVMYTLGTPEHVQVHEITVRPVGDMF